MHSLVDQLIATGQQLAAAGISPGSSGNISVRDDTHIYASGTGASLGTLAPENIAVLSLDGEYVSGARASKETQLHTAFYAKNLEHRAVVHLHSPNSVAWSCLAPWNEFSAIPPLTPYFVMRVGQTPLIPFRVPGSPELASLVAAVPFPFRAALLANHGQVTSGDDLAAAVDAAIEVEEACRIALSTAGMECRRLSDADIISLSSKWGTPWTLAS